MCAIRHNVDPRKDSKEADEITHVIPIAGNLLDHGGKAFEWGAERLRTSELPSDAEKEGVRLTLRGGRYEAREQRAVVELLCDKSRTGLEGEWDSSDKYVPGGPDDTPDDTPDDSPDNAMRLMRSVVGINGEKVPRADDKGYGEKQLKKDNTALLWEGYGHPADSTVDTLRLTWHTKHACEDGSAPSGSDNHWGFFTWMIILYVLSPFFFFFYPSFECVSTSSLFLMEFFMPALTDNPILSSIFLGTAAYLIFGSWLNYYRYGARGWDLLPHGDTIRDLPYLIKDWARRFLNTVQGSGSRGGYSAV